MTNPPKGLNLWTKEQAMFPRVKQVRHLGDYRLELTFADGTTGQLDFKEQVVGRGGVFQPLEDVSFFQQVRVDPEAGTLVWPNEVDFCPDVLYSRVTGKPIEESFDPVEIRGEKLSNSVLRDRE
jgi:hypothetical protein